MVINHKSGLMTVADSLRHLAMWRLTHWCASSCGQPSCGGQLTGAPGHVGGTIVGDDPLWCQVM